MIDIETRIQYPLDEINKNKKIKITKIDKDYSNPEDLKEEE